MKPPDYSPFARQYAQSRPRYPAGLFAHIASLLNRHGLAWDCATGNGQAALQLVEHFDRVIATDVSSEQIRHATPHPRIEYRVARSERSGLADASVDLVTVASAIHWFDLDDFGREVVRVVRPGGLLAAWTYHVGDMEAPLDRVFRRFYDEVLRTSFAAGARLVDDRYRSLALPGEPLECPDFFVSAGWTLDRMLGFIASWSGTQEYIRQRGEDPVVLIKDELAELWGDPEGVRQVRWPLYIRLARL